MSVPRHQRLGLTPAEINTLKKAHAILVKYIAQAPPPATAHRDQTQIVEKFIDGRNALSSSIHLETGKPL